MRTKLIFITILLATYLGIAQQDSVFATVSGDTVTIWNMDIEENCASIFTHSIVMLDSNVIVLTETDTLGPIANCICKFDLQLQLIGLGVGHYTVEVFRAYLSKFNYPKDNTIFIGSTSFDIGNTFSPLITERFYQSHCGGCVGVNTSGMDEFTNYSLLQNYPNPFNPSTTIHFELPKESHVTLKVYNMVGQEVMSVLDEEKVAGRYDLKIDGTQLASSVYYYRLIAGDYILTKKFVLLK
jgi:hypothetical protein